MACYIIFLSHDCHVIPLDPSTSYRVYCVMGDGESAEGSVWEAASFAGYYGLDNLVGIIDVNRLGQSQAAALEHNVDVYRARMESFGWHAIVVDGHDIEAVCKAFHDAATTKGKPTCLVAKTFKGTCICSLYVQLMLYLPLLIELCLSVRGRRGFLLYCVW